jgi:hypothetical protein
MVQIGEYFPPAKYSAAEHSPLWAFGCTKFERQTLHSRCAGPGCAFVNACVECFWWKQSIPPYRYMLTAVRWWHSWPNWRSRTLRLASGGAMQRIKLISGPSQSKFPASRSMSGRSELSELDLQLSCLSIDSRTSKFIVKKSISQDHADTKDSTTKNLSILSQSHIERSLKKFPKRQKRKPLLRFGAALQEVAGLLTSSNCIFD